MISTVYSVFPESCEKKISTHDPSGFYQTDVKKV